MRAHDRRPALIATTRTLACLLRTRQTPRIVATDVSGLFLNDASDSSALEGFFVLNRLTAATGRKSVP
jgi:hypothetical protein